MPDKFLNEIDLDKRESRWKRSLESLSKSYVFVAEDEASKVVGFAQGGPEEEGDPVYTAELGAIYLLEEVQRRGAGRRLFVAVMDALVADGHSSMLAWVIPRNPNRGFYEALRGHPVRNRVREHGGVLLEETAFGWDGLRPHSQDSTKDP